MQKNSLIIITMILMLAPSSLCAKTEVYFSPSKHTEEAIIQYIDNAKKSLDIAIYSITNQRIADAILRAKKRGLAIRILVDYRQSTGATSKHSYIGATVDKKKTTMHNKFTVRDESCVATGSFNYTNNAVSPNRENLVIICEKKIAKKFRKEFDTLWDYQQ